MAGTFDMQGSHRAHYPLQAELPQTCGGTADIVGVVDLGRGRAQSGGEFPLGEPAGAPELLRRAGRDARAACSDDTHLTATTTMPSGETFTGSTLVSRYLDELTTHTWDLGAAMLQLDRPDGDLAVIAVGRPRT